MQILWILEIYYFIANSCYGKLSIILGQSGINSTIPDNVNFYNNMILRWFENYHNIILVLALLIIWGAMCLSLLCYIFSDYSVIRTFVTLGIYFSQWLFFMYFTYILYKYLGSYFCLSGFFLLGIKIIIEKIKCKLGYYEEF